MSSRHDSILLAKWEHQARCEEDPHYIATLRNANRRKLSGKISAGQWRSIQRHAEMLVRKKEHRRQIEAANAALKALGWHPLTGFPKTEARNAGRYA